MNRNPVGSVQCNGFQSFGAHHRTQPGTRRHPPLVVGYACNQRAFLSRHANAGHGRRAALKPFPECRFGFPCILAPQVAGISQFCMSMFHMQINRRRADPGEENPVIAALFDRRRQRTAAVGIAPGARQWRFSHRHPAPGHHAAGPGQQPRDKPQHILRPQRVCPRRNPLIKQVGGQPQPGQHFFIYCIWDLFLFNFSGGQIHPQHLAHDSVHHIILSIQRLLEPASGHLPIPVRWDSSSLTRH